MNIIIGKKLQNLRKNKNISQEEMADNLNISQSTYARMESGKNHSWANHIFKISIFFEIKPHELLELDNTKLESNQDENSCGEIAKLSEKVIEQYKELIKELKKTIKDLKKERKIKKTFLN